MCFPPAVRRGPVDSPSEICAQSRLVDLPVAVLAPVEQNDGQTVPEFGPQIGIGCGSDIHVDAGDLDAELLRERLELLARRTARTAPGAHEKGQVMTARGAARCR